MLQELLGRGIIIHHWDTDGICSTRLILKHLKDKDITNKTPILGNYFLTEEELSKYSENYDYVIVVDMSIPEENILCLAKNAKVFIFDHHLGKVIKKVFHHNPVIKGENPDKYPSTSWIVNDYLGNPLNLYAILGVLGDHEQKIKNNKEFFKIITDFSKENNISFEELLKIVYLLDTNYKIRDKKSVEEAPITLLHFDSPDDILYNKKWNENYDKINKEIKSILSLKNEEINGIIFKKINTPFNIISTITRKISWDTGKNTLVLNTGFFDDKDQIYMRSKKDATPIIKLGKELGLKCGGKKEVLGAIVPKEKTESFIEEIINFLNQTEE
jgi:single-stranded DNA-specific DHH superfamily exonuclease